MTPSPQQSTSVPWALSRLTPVVSTDVPFVPIGLDPLSQTAIYRDPSGALVDPVEAGKHGRITNTYTRTGTQRGDGTGPRTADSDSTVDGRPDPGGSL